MSIKGNKTNQSYTLHDFTSVLVEDQRLSAVQPNIHVDANIELPGAASGVVVLSGTLMPDDAEAESTIDEFLDQEWERHEPALRYLADR